MSLLIIARAYVALDHSPSPLLTGIPLDLAIIYFT